MSHQIKLQTKILDKEILESSLTEAGYSFVENGSLVGYRGTNEGKVDILVKIGNYSNKVGFKFNKTDNCYDLVGDFYQTGISKENFKNNIQKVYTTKKVEQLIRKGRYNIIEKKNTINNTVTIRARSMVG